MVGKRCAVGLIAASYAGRFMYTTRWFHVRMRTACWCVFGVPVLSKPDGGGCGLRAPLVPLLRSAAAAATIAPRRCQGCGIDEHHAVVHDCQLAVS